MPLLLCVFIHAWIIPVGQLIGAIPRYHARFLLPVSTADGFFGINRIKKKGKSIENVTLSSIIAFSALVYWSRSSPILQNSLIGTQSVFTVGGKI